MIDVSTERGTTLVEAIVAIGILAGTVVALAGLSSVAIRHAAIARERSMATIMAFQKMEALCRDVSSTAVSPANAWSVDTPGYLEYLDARGNVTGGGPGGAYVRRWSVAPLPSDASLLAIQVDVAPCRMMPGATRCGDVLSHARLASVRSRVAW
jgi:type II secretory pathway pseudopilin PulG